MQTQSVGIGIIGAGRRMLNVLHLLLKENRGMRVVAIYDPQAAKCCTPQYRELCGGAAELPDAAAVCARSDVDWVLIGSPNAWHAEQVVTALQAGKHVFCEKPLALNLEQAEAIHAGLRAS